MCPYSIAETGTTSNKLLSNVLLRGATDFAVASLVEHALAVLLAAAPTLAVRLVNATVGRSARAEPVALQFEAGTGWIHGRLPELDSQLLGLIAGGGYEGPGISPTAPTRWPAAWRR